MKYVFIDFLSSNTCLSVGLNVFLMNKIDINYFYKLLISTSVEIE